MEHGPGALMEAGVRLPKPLQSLCLIPYSLQLLIEFSKLSRFRVADEKGP